MPTKNMLKSKKAISPILATLLLIVIAVAAIVVTYAWVMTYMSGATSRAGEELTVENVKFYGTNSINITLRSTGTSDSKVAVIYVGTSSTNLTSATVSPSLPQLILAGSSKTFTVTQSWTKGTRYYFKAVTESGLALPFNEQP
jgi:flagellin-like protein